jgi:hypothetical protein
MNIPGFTAEATLYGESGHYRTAGEHTQADGDIQPAIYRNYWYDRCYQECVGDCIPDPFSSYCENNCDCYCQGGPPGCWYM